MTRIFSLCFTVLMLMSGLNVFAEEINVKFATGEWAPYTGEKIAEHGMASEIVTAACKAVGLEAEYEFFPWKRAESVVAGGTHFGTFPYKELQEREGNFLFSETLFSSSFGIAMYKQNKGVSGFKYRTMDDLKNYTVGIVTGTDAIRLPLEKMGGKVEEVPGTEQNLKKLAAGRIDFYIDDKAVIYQALQQGYTPEQKAEFLFSEKDFGERNDFKIMISLKYPNSKEIMAKINEGLHKIKESGEQKSILAKYGL